MDTRKPLFRLLDKLSGDAVDTNRAATCSQTVECLHPGCGDADRLALTGTTSFMTGTDPAALLCFSCPSGHHAVIACYHTENGLLCRRFELGDDALDRLDGLLTQKGLAKPEPGKPCSCTTDCLLITALNTPLGTVPTPDPMPAS